MNRLSLRAAPAEPTPLQLIEAAVQARAKELANTYSYKYVSAFNDPWVIAGQATVFDEMLRQAPQIDQVVVGQDLGDRQYRQGYSLDVARQLQG